MPKIPKDKREDMAYSAYRYKLEGKPYREIGELLGVSHQTAANLVKFHMESKGIPDVDTERITQLDQLDMAIERVVRMIFEDAQLFQYGKCVRNADGSQAVDYELKLKAVKELRGLLDSRAKLTGAYSPIQQDITLSEGDTIDASVKALIADMEAQNAQQRESLASDTE